MTIKYQVKGYKSVFITTEFNSFGKLIESFSFSREVFKIFEHRPATFGDFVFIEILSDES